MKMPDIRNPLNNHEKKLIAEITNDIAKIDKSLYQIQLRSVYQLIGTDFVKTLMSEYMSSANMAARAYMILLDSIPKYVDLVYPLIQAQIEFRNQQALFIQNFYKTTNDALRQYIVEWSKISLKIHADIANLRFNFEYTEERYTEQQQVVINLKDGNYEKGLIEYQEIEHEGNDYQILLVPKTKYDEFKNQYVSLSVDYGNKNLFIGSLTKEELNIAETELLYSYDHVTKTIILGPYVHSIINGDLKTPRKRLTKNFRFIHFVLKYISEHTNETIWFFGNLETEFETHKYVDKNNPKRWKNAFDRLVKLLPETMEDLFFIGSDYIQLNKKYR